MTEVSGQTFERGCKKRNQLGKTFYRFVEFINRKYFTLILKMKTILINCTGKFCYRHEDFHKTEAAAGIIIKSSTMFTRKHLCGSRFLIKLQTSGLQVF